MSGVYAEEKERRREASGRAREAGYACLKEEI